MRACAPQGASCCIFYLGNAFFETFPKIVFFQNLGGGFLPSQRAVPLRTRESNQGRPCPVEKYCSKVKVTAEDGEYCPRIEGNIALELEEYCPANILKAGIVY